MPWQTQQVWLDEEDGPQAFSSVNLPNQQAWETSPDLADDAICEAIERGGFDSDCIRRGVGNYEGQIMAIRRGYATKEDLGWRITDAGRQFLTSKGKCPPDFLWATDDWHKRRFEFCLWQVTRNGQPYLKFAKEMYPRISVGMDPLFGRDDAMSLRDYLTAWLDREAPL